MLDFIFLLATGAFFLLAVLYVRGSQRLKRG